MQGGLWAESIEAVWRAAAGSMQRDCSIPPQSSLITICQLSAFALLISAERGAGKNTLLHAAVAAKQSTELLLLLVAAAPSLASAGDSQGRTALHVAAEQGLEDAVQALLLAAPEASAVCDSAGRTPLVAAYERRQLSGARALVAAAAGNGTSLLAGVHSCLFRAAEQGEERELRALLWLAAEAGDGDDPVPSLLVSPPGQVGPSLLHVAAMNGHVGTTRVLLEAAPQLAMLANPVGWTQLHWVVATGMNSRAEGLVQLLVAIPGAAAALDINGCSPLFLAIKTRSSLNCIRLLATAAPDAVAWPDQSGDTPVHLAARYEEALQVLLEVAPAQVAAAVTAATAQQTPLQLAVDQRRWVAVVQLLEAVMQVSNSNGQHGPAIALQLLLQAAHDPAVLALPAMDGGDFTIIHAAAERPTAAVLQLLLSAQLGDVMAANASEQLPLHVAALHGRADAVRLLLAAAPAAVEVGDFQGCLPLHLAVRSKDTEVVRLLLTTASSSTLTAATRAGWLPLHCAARHGNAAMVRLLLGAYPQAAGVATRAGATALLLALRFKNAEAAQLLMRHGSTQELMGTAAAGPPRMRHLLAYIVAARLPLDASEWALVPSPCPGLCRALPAALQHPPEQARQLVQHLPAADAERVQVAALALGRAQRRQRVHLPGTLIGRILSLALQLD
jgi:ankyrin repeat protein